MFHGMVLVVVDEAVGIVGAAGAEATLPISGDTLVVDTAAAELTPRLPIS
jgi:hypothetical protein